MTITQISLFSALTDKMRWHQTRQGVLAENVANAETPGFRGSDLKAFDIEARERNYTLKPISTAATRPEHFSVVSASSAAAFGAAVEGGFDVTPDANGVTLEEQMMKVAENQIDYQAATSLYTRSVRLLKTALGRSA